MQITRARMRALEAALDRLHATGIGEENLGFWVEHQKHRMSIPDDVAAARREVVDNLPALRQACQDIMAIIDGKALPPDRG